LRFSLLLLLAAAALPGAAAAINLFEAGQGGYVTYRIPGMVTLGDGTILAYAEARKDGTGDWADIDIVLRRSSDAGVTWTPPVVIADAGTATTNNVVAIPGKGRHEVHLIYCVNYAQAMYRHSTDSGNTFSPPVDITSAFEAFRQEYPWNVIAAGPGHGIRLKNGRLLVPVWLPTGGKTHRPSVVSTIYSDDGGLTWHRGEIIRDGLVNPSETAAVQLEDGRVMLNIRSESDALRRAVAYSRDGASGWSTPRFHPDLKEPVCMASLIRDGAGTLLFLNPDNLDAGALEKKGHNSTRRNLTLRGSFDQGETWSISRVIDPGVSGYSDMTLTRSGEVLILYERGGLNQNMFFTAALTLERVPASALRRNHP